MLVSVRVRIGNVIKLAFAKRNKGTLEKNCAASTRRVCFPCGFSGNLGSRAINLVKRQLSTGEAGNSTGNIYEDIFSRLGYVP